MKNINIDFNLIVNEFLSKTKLYYKNFQFFIREDFLLRNEGKSHNLGNHIENFKEKIKINQQAENPRDFRKYDIHYVNFGINIGNEINGIRPSLIYKSNRHNRGFDIFVIPMTGLYDKNKQEKDLDGFDIVIHPNIDNKLKKESLMKVRHLKSISKKRILNKIGRLKNLENDENISSLYDEIDNKIKQIFGIK
ncbi:type II toxin-antitoxin system PemK/MazF family toxin [Candidatus Gracilibacteria bacterium 28_42_T64]|nr:type II toxin-antitoxin system PemK/MazF family toxin [Candidatus Gracilibacteria bacterium 28_42_T64]